MLSSSVFVYSEPRSKIPALPERVESHPRRSPDSFLTLALIPFPLSRKSFPFIFFCRPPPSNPFAIILFQKQWGEASLRTMDQFHFLPSSVHSSKFRIPQVLYLPFLRKHGGCGGILPVLGHADVQTFRRADLSLSPVFSRPCALFCTQQKLNSFLFKRFRTLCQKPPGVGGPLPLISAAGKPGCSQW
jgi:hypothetical protein